MRKTIISSLMLLMFSGFVHAQGGGYKIKMKVKNIKDTVCYLANYYGNKQYIQDTARADADGNIVFEGKEKLAGGIYIAYFPSIKTNSKIFEIIVTNVQNFSLETDTVDFIKTMKVKGSDENKYWYEYMNFVGGMEKNVAPLQEKLKSLEKNPDSTKIIREKLKVFDDQVVKYKNDFITKYPTTFVAKLFKAMKEVEATDEQKKASTDSLFVYKYYKAHFFDNIDLTDSTFLRTPLLHKKIDFYISKLTSPHPDSIIVACDYLINKTRKNKEMFKYMVWYTFSTYGGSQIMGYDKIYVHMAEKYYATGQAYWVDTATLRKINEHAVATKPLLIGKKAPDITTQDSLGQYINLYSLRNQYVIAVFWDDDCGHCKTEMPKLKDFYSTYKAKGLDIEVLAVCTEDELPKWKKFIKEQQYQWKDVVDPFGERRKYDIQSTPIIYIMDKDKTIIAKKLGADQVGEFLDHYIKEIKK